MSLNEPITKDELLNAKADYDAVQSEYKKANKQEAGFRQSDIRFAIRHNDKVTRTCRVRGKRKKQLEKKRDRQNDKKLEKQRQEREQAARVRTMCKHTKEMRNRDAVIEKAKSMYDRSLNSESTRDDLFALSALGLGRRFDSVIYNTPTSDVSKIMDDMFDDIFDDDTDGDIDNI